MNIINGKKVNCKNFPKCEWSDKVGIYKNLIENECLYEKIHCDNCQQFIDRKDFLFHVNDCANKYELIEETEEKTIVSFKNKCIYPQCEIYFNKDITSHLIESKLSHEKMFIKQFYEFKKSIEDRFNKLETKLSIKKKREELIEDAESDVECTKQISYKKKSLDKCDTYDNRKKGKNKYDLYVVENLPKEDLKKFSLNDDNEDNIKDITSVTSSHKETRKKSIKKEYLQKPDVDSLMNVIEFSRGLRIIGNKVINRGISVKHRFAFMNYFLNETSLKWTVEIKSIKEWIGLGICFKDEIIVSGFKFEKPLLHSTFLITSNGYVWNCMNEKENGIDFSFLMLKKGDIVKFHYDKVKCCLRAKFNDHKIELTNVFSQRLNFLVPCVILLHENDEVEFNLIE